ncbi:MFS transporter [Nocardia arthritidis]|uniref:DHA2 family efflux MFS transporter permease subunit n=1 Tax=Nocardia arthritidis TaxID=228602 RepID=A0A6G9YM83_9NOCA|nr:MFS transporter [Nocardia arthritidis]QIS14033.1 DHA2 family efflux MFS transporter permease subunit [Nocardia arthritidis]
MASGTTASARRRVWFTIVACAIPAFMGGLDNLVVSNALVAISRDLHESETELQWVVNGYTLAFAGLMLTCAGLGDRFGRRLVFVSGVLIFMTGSAISGLSESLAVLLVGRVTQGVGAAAVLPLSLTLLAAAVPAAKRGAAVGLWGGISGLGIALGPVVGGAITQGLAWEWIFWINLPIGVLAVVLILRTIEESRGPDADIDLPGALLGSAAVTVAVWAIVKGPDYGWTSARIAGGFVIAAVLLLLFLWWERRAASPLLPLRFYRSRGFVFSNIVSVALYFGLFGSIFLMAQYLQRVMGYNAFQAGLRTLPWSLGPMLIAPPSGLLTDRIGGGRLMALGMAVDAVALGWLACLAHPGTPYPDLVPPMLIGGLGMGMVWAPVTSVVLGSVGPQDHAKAAGTNSTLREVGGALGVAVCTSVFTHYFHRTPLHSFADIPVAFSNGLRAALWLSTAVVLAAVFAALAIPRPRLRGRSTVPQPDSAQSPEFTPSNEDEESKVGRNTG